MQKIPVVWMVGDSNATFLGWSIQVLRTAGRPPPASGLENLLLLIG